MGTGKTNKRFLVAAAALTLAAAVSGCGKTEDGLGGGELAAIKESGKLVIATEGQHVTVDYATHTVYVDGEALDEPYINEVMNDPFSPSMTVLDVTVPEGSIYVLGDNRNHSADSRHQALGVVDTRYVLGRAVWIVLPVSRFGTVK